ncbi:MULTISPECIES: hypothetical protein [Kitasatospora]|uniref:Resolvase/invertase-type recombinase catalytic domain-containing protein n=1 Tax=Kitasatospora setae (strain ATCC 33774 / DSM 43861 / JCM 3304 / KCC A-0304 / NBRC 14216 / KM-6054) TaxID=452652 RepID=E4NJU6_KITSK|nr:MULTISPECIES: hypothetical protein [Kitasatospora]BAJ33244.1 hypothetical protein KSE_74900 [Kitasatospora setae KM-6054]
MGAPAALSRWLNDPDGYDALVFWRFDRAVRSTVYMCALANWAREHRKVPVSAEGPGRGGRADHPVARRG